MWKYWHFGMFLKYQNTGVLIFICTWFKKSASTFVHSSWHSFPSFPLPWPMLSQFLFPVYSLFHSVLMALHSERRECHLKWMNDSLKDDLGQGWTNLSCWNSRLQQWPRRNGLESPFIQVLKPGLTRTENALRVHWVEETEVEGCRR